MKKVLTLRGQTRRPACLNVQRASLTPINTLAPPLPGSPGTIHLSPGANYPLGLRAGACIRSTLARSPASPVRASGSGTNQNGASSNSGSPPGRRQIGKDLMWLGPRLLGFGLPQGKKLTWAHLQSMESQDGAALIRTAPNADAKNNGCGFVGMASGLDPPAHPHPAFGGWGIGGLGGGFNGPPLHIGSWAPSAAAPAALEITEKCAHQVRVAIAHK
jgi:hypothetical protein